MFNQDNLYNAFKKRAASASSGVDKVIPVVAYFGTPPLAERSVAAVQEDYSALKMNYGSCACPPRRNLSYFGSVVILPCWLAAGGEFYPDANTMDYGHQVRRFSRVCVHAHTGGQAYVPAYRHTQLIHILTLQSAAGRMTQTVPEQNVSFANNAHCRICAGCSIGVTLTWHRAIDHPHGE
eukprot:COSAG01_NODE_3603_length_5885_cov_6.630315_5_plen_180_part_00